MTNVPRSLHELRLLMFVHMCHSMFDCSSIEVLMKYNVSTNSATDCLVKTTKQEVTSAVLKLASDGNYEALEIILRHRDDAKNAFELETEDSLLHVSAQSDAGGSVKCLSLLLDHGLDIEKRNKAGRTPIHAAARGKKQLMRSLFNFNSYRVSSRKCEVSHTERSSAQHQG